MRRLLVLVLLATAIVLGRPPALAGACSCAVANPAEYAENADAVFSGSWVDDDHEFPEEDPDDAIDRVIHTFAVDRVYKGEVAAEAQVFSHPYSASCGAEFQDGRYLVYAYLDERSGDLSTNLCSGNENLDKNGTIPAELGEGVAPIAAPAPGGGEVDPDEQASTSPAMTNDGSGGDVIERSTFETLRPVLAVAGGATVLVAAGLGVWALRRRSA